MFALIPELLSAIECAAMRAALSDGALWRDGAATAGGAAKRAKHNLQGDPSAPAVKGVLEKARRAMLADDRLVSLARPARLARVMATRAEAGMGYGDHIDGAFIDGVRTDLSFTIFLSEPDEYAGGALVARGPRSESESARPPAGSCVLYPATTIHRVEPVRRGVRLAIVGWIESSIARADDRETLFALDEILRAIGDHEARLEIAALRGRLMRRFSE